MARARTAPPREVPVDCSSTNNARERDATRRREGAFVAPGQGRGDSSRNSERHVPRRKTGARTTSTTGNYRRGFIDQVPGPTAPAGDMAVRNSPASTRRDTKTQQMRM